MLNLIDFIIFKFDILLDILLDTLHSRLHEGFLFFLYNKNNYIYNIYIYIYIYKIIGLYIDVKLRSPSNLLYVGAHIDTSTLMHIHLYKGYGLPHANGCVMYLTIYPKINLN